MKLPQFLVLIVIALGLAGWFWNGEPVDEDAAALRLSLEQAEPEEPAVEHRRPPARPSVLQTEARAPEIAGESEPLTEADLQLALSLARAGDRDVATALETYRRDLEMVEIKAEAGRFALEQGAGQKGGAKVRSVVLEQIDQARAALNASRRALQDVLAPRQAAAARPRAP